MLVRGTEVQGCRAATSGFEFGPRVDALGSSTERAVPLRATRRVVQGGEDVGTQTRVHTHTHTHIHSTPGVEGSAARGTEGERPQNSLKTDLTGPPALSLLHKAFKNTHARTHTSRPILKHIGRERHLQTPENLEIRACRRGPDWDPSGSYESIKLILPLCHYVCVCTPNCPCVCVFRPSHMMNPERGKPMCHPMVTWVRQVRVGFPTPTTPVLMETLLKHTHSFNYTSKTPSHT